jgi:UDP-N-acetylmuramoylalanine--D-glutamate ligase
MKQDWKNKKVGVLGLGIEGQSSAVYLKAQGADVTVLDQKEKNDFDEATLATLENEGIHFEVGGNYKEQLGNFDVIVRSPGVKLSGAEREELKKKNIQVTSQTQLFLELCPARVIGVTGTKGKGTTSTLIYEMLKASGIDVYLGGNIGTPPFSFLDDLKKTSVVVLELSSFQLQDISISPHIAVLLMIVPEHLDYHADESEYIEAKRNMLRFQTSEDFAVINRDYVASNESDMYTEGKVFQVTRERTTTEQGCFLKDDAVWIRMQGAEWKIIDTDEVALPGKHNMENICAAVMAATLAGATKAEIARVLKAFTGLEHRIELVNEINGVKYYDDSFSTTPETAIAAIQTFTQPEILILGGSGKNSDFSELGKVISEAKNIKAIIGIGEEWPRIRAQIAKGKEQRVVVEGATDMQTVVQAAAKIAEAGDVVLLSPGCASFGMFKNYKDRGEQFKTAVNEIKL